MQVPKNITDFFHQQSYVIVSTIDSGDNIYCSAKGLVGFDKEGKLLLVDLYLRDTYKNLERDPRISVTAINEHKFIGYTLQGRAKLIIGEAISSAVIESWENHIVRRMSQRVVKGVQAKVKSHGHFEASLPSQPQVIIEVEVENIIDLAPPMMRKSHHT